MLIGSKGRRTVTRYDRNFGTSAPSAFEDIRTVHYRPDRWNLPFLADANGVLHSESRCASDLKEVETLPTIGQWLGLDPALCFCVSSPADVIHARDMLRAYQQLPVLPPTNNLTATTIGSWAVRTMTARRQLEKFSPMNTTVNVTNPPLGATHSTSTFLSRASHQVAAELNRQVAHLKEQLNASLEAEEVRAALIERSPDRVIIIPALDNYQLHDDITASADGDLADVCAATFTYASTVERVAVRAPRGLVNFLALYRKGGGFVEADNDPDTEPAVVETALVLWEPDSTSAYGRWRDALAAAHKLL
jgi:hypothetical protein